MPVPETSVHEDCSSEPREHNIRFPRQVFSMQPEAVSLPVQHRADLDFGYCIASPDA